MKHILTTFFAAVAFYSCGSSSYTITGRCELTPGDSIFLLGCDNSVLASGIIAPDTTFTLKGRITTPDIASVTDRFATVEPAVIFLEPGIVRITPRDNRGYRISGTPLNDRADSIHVAYHKSNNLLQEEIRSSNDPNKTQPIATARDRIISEAIAANSDNLLGIYLFCHHRSHETPAATRAQIARFSPEMQAHPALRGVLERIEGVERTTIGQPYTDLSLCDTDGTTIPLSTLIGKNHWVLLEFWATWCHPCCLEIPYLRQAYTDFSHRGLSIYGVSLDNDQAKWAAFVQGNNMPWINVRGVDDDKKSNPASKYGINSIPANFLISPEGIITAKNLRGEELTAKLTEMLK